MKQTKLNSLILDAFDTVVGSNCRYSSNNAVEVSFRYLNLFLCQLGIDDACCEEIFKQYVRPSHNWSHTTEEYNAAQTKLLFISLLAIMDDTELKEIFGISPLLPRV